MVLSPFGSSRYGISVGGPTRACENTISCEYDPLGRIIGNVIFNFYAAAAGEVDGLGRLKVADETIIKLGGTTVAHDYTFSYDRHSQLTSADMTNTGRSTWSASYDYKKNGDMDSRMVNNTQTDFTYSGNLTSDELRI